MNSATVDFYMSVSKSALMIDLHVGLNPFLFYLSPYILVTKVEEGESMSSYVI